MLCTDFSVAWYTLFPVNASLPNEAIKIAYFNQFLNCRYFTKNKFYKNNNKSQLRHLVVVCKNFKGNPRTFYTNRIDLKCYTNKTLKNLTYALSLIYKYLKLLTLRPYLTIGNLLLIKHKKEFHKS